MSSDELSNVELLTPSSVPNYFLKHITPLSFGERPGDEAW